MAEAGETETTQRRHRDYFHSLADQWRQQTSSRFSYPWHEPWTRGGEIEQDNFRAALEWSLARGEHAQALRMLAALWSYWWYAGHLDVRDWLERALADPDGADDPARWEALTALALKYEEEGDGEGAERLASEALDMAERVGNEHAVAFSRMVLGIRVLGRGERERAHGLLAAALAQAEALGDRMGMGTCHHDLGWIAMGEADQAAAKAHFERAVELSRHEEVSETLRLHFLAALAPAAALAGETDRAGSLAAEAVASARGLHLRRVLVMALVRAAETAVLTGALAQARDLVGELLALLAELGARRWVADTIELAAILLETDGQAQPAARLLGACDGLRQVLGEPAGGLRALAPTVRACRDRLGETLGDGPAAEQEELGRNLSIEEGISYALEWLNPEGLRPARHGTPIGATSAVMSPPSLRPASP